jgi:type IV secretory pathway TrbL component
MACTNCDNNIWKKKLGRCERCMWLNFVLLLVSAIFSYFMVQVQPKSVETIAVLFTLFCSALLMLLHMIAFIYYRLVKANKYNPK